MRRFFLFPILLVFIATSCKTISIRGASKASTTQSLVLGSIGSGKDFLLQKEFNSTALPNYKTPIKVAINVKPFKKHLFKTFLKARALQPANVDLNYIDSLDVKPKYIDLEIADKVSLVEALNTEENTSLKRHLNHNASANLITSISMALHQEDFEKLINAESVFLVENGQKTYALQLYKNGSKTAKINFNKVVVFAYKTANCCWQESTRHKLNIVDLVEEHNNCPKKTYRLARKAQKKVNRFKALR
jgi:hypothetical protein